MLCYLCGAPNPATRDHIPPKGFFPPPLPNDLITLPCCEPCNRSFSLDDDAVRLWASTSVFNSSEGKWIFQNRVVESTLRRSPRLRAQLPNFIGSRSVRTDAGHVTVPTFGIPTARVIPFIKRIAKGIVHFHYPEYRHIDAEYGVEHVLATNTTAQQAMNELGQEMNYGERGGRVFRYWHAFTTDNPNKGALIFKFYDGVTFLVRFGHGLEELQP